MNVEADVTIVYTEASLMEKKERERPQKVKGKLAYYVNTLYQGKV